MVKCAAGLTKGFNVKVGLHQRSALSPFLFAIAMDRLTNEIKEEALWPTMFTNDVVLYRKSKEEVETKLESWRNASVIWSKIVYLCLSKNKNNDDEVRLLGVKLA